MQKGYLIELEEREKKAYRLLVQNPGISKELFAALGLDSYFSWYLLDIRCHKISKDFSADEIDIIAGKLTWKNSEDIEKIAQEIEKQLKYPISQSNMQKYVALSGGICWPPVMDYLIALEAKCSYLDPHASLITEDSIKSKKLGAKDSKRIRKKIERELKMGFNKIAMLDFIANPPVDGGSGNAWFLSGNIAIASREASQNALSNRLPKNSPAGHWLISIGSIAGGFEDKRASINLPYKICDADDNVIVNNDDVQIQRKEMEYALIELLKDVKLSPQLFNFWSPSIILIDCMKCNKIHCIDETCGPI